jgi:hypothetical protein
MEPVKDNNTPEKIDYSDTFLRYLLTLQSGALIALGKIKNPDDENSSKNGPQAREIITILSMLKQKTQGNLNETETKIISSLLANLQLSYIEEFALGDKKDV